MSAQTTKMVVGCSSCSEPNCPLSEAKVNTCPEGHRVLTGWVFSATCILVFLLPIGLAIAGAMLYPNNNTYGFFAGLLGFFGGTLISKFISGFYTTERKTV